ncbi:MAG: hypothetical protein EZS28_023208 [Streblomastix strix]|uniref:5'-3' DNA helicase ZGRF1-like N-terminal domain-containing protein n=1 Tax=Streblomastix strix TaxID=222440 RepID=A0A5J4VFK1_9EUKA|nr:MAG: hypothetical protein EZS28_023208 [Streblomastix strix]
MYTKHKTQKTKSFADGTCLVSPPSKIVIKDSSGALVSTEFSFTICQDILKNGTTDFETERFLIQLGDQIPIDGIPQVDEIQKGKQTQTLQNTRPKLINKPQARNPQFGLIIMSMATLQFQMSKEWSDQLTASKSYGTPSGKKRALLNKHGISSPTSSNRSLQRTDAELILALSSFLDKEQH